jgi:hypothetical protein
MDQSTKIENLLRKIEALSRRQDGFHQKLENLRLEIDNLLNLIKETCLPAERI